MILEFRLTAKEVEEALIQYAKGKAECSLISHIDPPDIFLFKGDKMIVIDHCIIQKVKNK